MGRTSSSRPSSSRRRARPMLEGLEARWVPSQAAGGLSIVADSSPPTGEFFHNDQQFNYTTPDGTHVEIKIIGVGSLQGNHRRFQRRAAPSVQQDQRLYQDHEQCPRRHRAGRSGQHLQRRPLQQ